MMMVYKSLHLAQAEQACFYNIFALDIHPSQKVNVVFKNQSSPMSINHLEQEHCCHAFNDPHTAFFLTTR